MANNGGSRSAAPGKNESLIIGILVGMMLGLAIAGGVAWFLMKRPSPYLSTEPTNSGKPADTAIPAPATPAAQAVPAPQAASGVDGQPRFEFYKILTDNKQDNAATAPATSTPPKVAMQANNNTSQPPAASQSDGPYFLQAASFTSADDADKLKARLALIGMEAKVQTANVPDKGVRYRVRLGPYRNMNEVNRANIVLKQNGIMDAATMRGQ